MPLKSNPDRAPDTGRQRIGAVYAKALLGATEKTGTTDLVLGELESLIRDMLDRFSGLEATLASPRVSAKEKMALLDRLLGSSASDQLLRFLEVVCAHERLDCLREIHQQALRQLDEKRGVVEVHLTAAEPLAGSLAEKIADVLRRALGRDVRLRQAINRELIGGLVVRVGDKVYDASVANRLGQLRAEVFEKTVHHMRSEAARFAIAD